MDDKTIEDKDILHDGNPLARKYLLKLQDPEVKNTRVILGPA